MTTATAKTARTKRQKQVFADAEAVAHVWAQQSQSYGCNPSRNIYFERETIFSYGGHFPLARFAGRGVVLVTNRSYSVTTSRHQRAVDDSLRGLEVTKIYCHDPQANRGHWHAQNLERLWADLLATAKQHEKARREDYRDDMRRQLANLAAYAAFARKGRTKRLAELVKASNKDPQFWASLANVTPKSAAAIDAEKAERQAKLDARRAEQRAREEARNARENELYAAFEPLAAVAWRASRERFDVPAELAERFADCLSADQVARGINAESVLFRRWDSPTMLRIVGDEIQTSRGARVTVRAAVRAWPHLRAHQVPPQPVGQFHAERFADGVLYIGCHRIPVSEMNLIAKQLGLDGQIGEV